MMKLVQLIGVDSFMNAKKSRKLIRIIRRIGIVLAAALVLFVVSTFIHHKLQTSKELKLLKENGYYNPVSVGDYSLNVSIFGNENGKHTIVGLAGLGTGDYSVAARQMTACLEADNKIVFIDRAGYGLSDDTANEMTLEYIVRDYRKALKNAGIEGPYILMPHSIGGAYATYWESNYPEEIEAIVFVDGSELCADAFNEEPVKEVTIGAKALESLAKMGFSRYVLRKYNYHLPENYSDEEQKLSDAMMLMTLDSIAPVSESGLIAPNAQAAFNGIVTNDIPKLYICSSIGIQTREELLEYFEWVSHQIEINNLNVAKIDTNPSDEYVENYLSMLEQYRNDIIYPYADKLGNCKVVCLGGDHMIYQQKPEECGVLIKEFIDTLK